MFGRLVDENRDERKKMCTTCSDFWCRRCAVRVSVYKFSTNSTNLIHASVSISSISHLKWLFLANFRSIRTQYIHNSSLIFPLDGIRCASTHQTSAITKNLRRGYNLNNNGCGISSHEKKLCVRLSHCDQLNICCIILTLSLVASIHLDQHHHPYLDVSPFVNKKISKQ